MEIISCDMILLALGLMVGENGAFLGDKSEVDPLFIVPSGYAVFPLLPTKLKFWVLLLALLSKLNVLSCIVLVLLLLSVLLLL